MMLTGGTVSGAGCAAPAGACCARAEAGRPTPASGRAEKPAQPYGGRQYAPFACLVIEPIPPFQPRLTSLQCLSIDRNPPMAGFPDFVG